MILNACKDISHSLLNYSIAIISSLILSQTCLPCQRPGHSLVSQLSPPSWPFCLLREGPASASLRCLLPALRVLPHARPLRSNVLRAITLTFRSTCHYSLVGVEVGLQRALGVRSQRNGRVVGIDESVQRRHASQILPRVVVPVRDYRLPRGLPRLLRSRLLLVYIRKASLSRQLGCVASSRPSRRRQAVLTSRCALRNCQRRASPRADRCLSVHTSVLRCQGGGGSRHLSQGLRVVD